MKKIVLDTNAYARLLGGDNNVLHAIASADTVFMSVFVLGELYTGFLRGTKTDENRGLLKRFLSKPTVKILNATSETAEYFGLIKSSLLNAGTPIPINDIWIAAHAMETGAGLISFDHHFKNINGLRLWEPD